MVRAKTLVIKVDDVAQGLFLVLGVLFVVRLFLGEVFLNLLDVGADVGGWGEDGGNAQRDEIRVGQLAAILDGGR